MDLTGDTPETEIDDIEFGKVPGWLVGVAEAIYGAEAENDIDLALEDIELEHTYTPTLTDGQVQIDGVP